MEKIIIDCDTGIDDFSTILLAVKSKKFDILGITTVSGNCSLENATRNTLKALEMLNATDIKVYKGCNKSITERTQHIDATNVHGENGFSNVKYDDPQNTAEEENAIDFLISEINKYPNEVTLVQIGPLTNLATAIKKNSNIVSKIKRVVIMGGSTSFGNVTKTSEFNFYKDAEAAKMVFEAGIENIVMIGLNVTTKVVLNSKLEKFLQESNSGLAHFLYDISRNGAEFDRKDAGTDGSIMHDPNTIGYLLNESLFQTKDCYVEISIEDENLGQSIVDDNYLLNGKKSNCKAAYDVDANEFLRIFFTTVFEDFNSDKYLDD